MKKLIIGLLVILSLPGMSQNWITDFEKAKTNAQESGNNIILVFSGSDWCVPCIKLEKEIWETQAFQSYADSNFVMLRADFPKRKKNRLSKEQQAHNEMLAEKYNSRGTFPLVVVLNSRGDVLGKTGYKGVGPEKYISILNSFAKE